MFPWIYDFPASLIKYYVALLNSTKLHSLHTPNPPDSGPYNTSHSASLAIPGFSPTAAAVFMKGIIRHGACDSRRQGLATQEASLSPILCKDWCTRCHGCVTQTLFKSLVCRCNHLPMNSMKLVFYLRQDYGRCNPNGTPRIAAPLSWWPCHAGLVVEKGWLFAPRQ